MKPRERMLILLTAIAALIFITARLGVFDLSSLDLGQLRVTEAQIQAAADNARRALDILEREDETRAAYQQKVLAYLPHPAPGKDPLAQFSEEVEALPRKLNIGMRLSKIEVSKKEPLAGASGFQLATLAVSYLNAPWSELVKLLNGYNQNGYLIQELTIVSKVDQLPVDLTVRLARVIPAEPAEKKGAGKAPGEPPRRERKLEGAQPKASLDGGGPAANAPSPDANPAPGAGLPAEGSLLAYPPQTDGATLPETPPMPPDPGMLIPGHAPLPPGAPGE